CAKCGRRHKFFKKLVDNNNIDVEMEKQNVKPLPKEDSFTCDCGNVIDLKAVKNDLDMLPKKK
ncbi:MAG: thioredoxin family protein, partial [Eubacterium sp.]|nr:thioredoxin family protein [Eubacterium sp.]